MADIAQKYANLVTTAHEKAHVQVMFTPGAQVAATGFYPLGAFLSSDVANAAGYHDVDPKGRPYGKGFLDSVPHGELLHDKSGHGASLLGVLTHELAEMIGDALANLWAALKVTDPETGSIYSLAAAELCDWTQNFAFVVTATDGTAGDCSDFVFPRFFCPSAAKGEQLSYMGVPTAPGEVAPGCYGIVANETDDGQVFAYSAPGASGGAVRIFHAIEKPPVWRESLQGHEAGRTTWRLKAA